MAELKLEIGKRYVRRDGQVSGALEHSGEPGYPFLCPRSGCTYTHQGLFSHGRSGHSDNLMVEYIKPLPEADECPLLRWKRGIPTEDEIRDCWIISAGDGLVPMFAPHLSQVQSSARVFLTDIWYIAFRVNPELPKPKPSTQMVTLRKWVEPNGTGEYTWMRDDMNHKAYGYTRTNETKQIEVATCPKSQS